MADRVFQSRHEKLLFEQAVVESQTHVSSQSVVDQPDGTELDAMASAVIIPAVSNQFRLVIVGNVGQVDACLSIDHDAVSGMGIPLPPNTAAITIPIGPGRSLNGITAVGATRVTFQSFGSQI